MRTTKIKSLLFTLFAVASLGLTACGTSEDPSTPPADTSSEEVVEGALSIALAEGINEIELKIDQAKPVGSYWTITKEGGNPTNAEKKVVCASSDESVVSIAESSATANPTFMANKVGDCTVTVTLSKDSTKSIAIPVTVTDAFFDYKLSTIHEADDVSKELPESRSTPGGKVVMGSNLDSSLIVRGSKTSGAFYLEGKIKVGALDGTDNFPKIGLMAVDLEDTANSVRVFVDTPIGDGGAYNHIGTVECDHGASWGWQFSVPDETARHKDAAYTTASTSTVFTVGMLRDGSKYHVFVNNVYAYTWKALDALVKNTDSSDREMYAGFWNFNGVGYTLEDYFWTKDSTYCNSKKSGIVENLITSFDPKTTE